MFKKKSKIDTLLTDTNKSRIVEAIALAEKNTSGEIRVHLENFLPAKQNSFQRATEVFHDLKMDSTQDRNGMLIYVAVEDHQFSIIGDAGINEKVGQNFWDTEKEQLVEYFKSDRLIDGIVYFVGKAGEKLKEFFPYQTNDVNELPDDISIGKN